jgi:hypothetical protein
MNRAPSLHGLTALRFAAPLLILAAVAFTSFTEAILFSPLLLLIALYLSGERIYESILDFVLGLAGAKPRAPQIIVPQQTEAALLAAGRHVRNLGAPRAPPAIA